MKPKSKAGGKSKITFDTRKPPEMPFEPFRFEKWTDDDLKPPPVTMESKIAEFLETARRESEWSAVDRAEGKINEARILTAMAKASRAKAAKWRKLSSLPKAEGESLDRKIWGDLLEGVDFLLARNEHDELGAGLLRLVVVHAMKGLLALAAHGKTSAATSLVNCLIEGVRRFECLAMHRPELFIHHTQRLALIPATISPQSDNAKECQDLLETLKVGRKSMYSVTGKGKRWKQQTPVNDLALRLVAYIDSNCRFQRAIFEIAPKLYAHWPQWISEAVRLPDFNADTSGQWAEIGWTILLELTNDRPQDNPHLRPIGESAAKKKPKYCKTLHEGTKASNVKGKIKERLLAAFRTIARREDSSPGMLSKKGGNGESSVT